MTTPNDISDKIKKLLPSKESAVVGNTAFQFVDGIRDTLTFETYVDGYSLSEKPDDRSIVDDTVVDRFSGHSVLAMEQIIEALEFNPDKKVAQDYMDLFKENLNSLKIQCSKYDTFFKGKDIRIKMLLTIEKNAVVYDEVKCVLGSLKLIVFERRIVRGKPNINAVASCAFFNEIAI